MEYIRPYMKYYVEYKEVFSIHQLYNPICTKRAEWKRYNLANYSFLYSLWAKIGFYVFSWLKKIKRRIFHDTHNYKKVRFCCPQINFYWNIATLVHLHSIWLLLSYSDRVDVIETGHRYLLFVPLQIRLLISSWNNKENLLSHINWLLNKRIMGRWIPK